MGGFALTGKIEFLPYVKVLNANPPTVCTRTRKHSNGPYYKSLNIDFMSQCMACGGRGIVEEAKDF